MKKLKLSLDVLEVSSFAPAKKSGDVHAMAVTAACPYPSQYCSGPGCVMTYWDTCMTSSYSAC
jgi:hypothetical protein